MDLKLYSEIKPLGFDSHQLRMFSDALKDQDAHTVMYPIDLAEQVVLKPDATTLRGGFKYGPVAFRQICKYLAPGLSNVLADLAGMRRVKSESDRNRFSAADAVAVFNMVVRRRFSADLEGLQAVRDTRTGMIEGVVGRGYKRLSNYDLYERSAEILRAYRHPVEFHRADLTGRSVVFCYRDVEPAFSLPAPDNKEDRFYTGYYYSNSEVGDGSVRATTVLIRGSEETRSLGFFAKRARLNHAGKDFAKRFEQMMDSVAEKRPDADRMKAGLLKLSARPLGFDVATEDEREERFKTLQHCLETNEAARSVSKKVLRSVILRGSHDGLAAPDVRLVDRRKWADRSAYDLYNAMGRVARNLPVTTREQVEQLAYSLLLGKLNLRDGEKRG